MLCLNYVNMNCFGRMYYGKNKQYKRSLWTAFKCFIEWDILNKLTGEKYYNINGKWVKHYWWNKR